MSETYTVGGDTWQPLLGFDISGQTFTPIQSHTLYYVDLNLRLFSMTPPQIAISACDASHTPIGAILSYGNHIGPLAYLPGTILRVRFLLETPLNLLEGQIYSIWVYRAITDTGDTNHVRYDKDDATYPRGHIIFSDDGGNTWTHFPNSDLIFCEFGGPPSPPPVADPPIPNWAPEGLTYIPLLDGVRFCLSTSVPCHLTCYWTDVEPRKHRTTRTVRGLDVPWNTYYCFVAWREVEQTEPGDTLYHTFDITPWPLGERRWFTFRGEVDDVQSPSVGPIFYYTPTAYRSLDDILRPDAPGDVCSNYLTGTGPPCPAHWMTVSAPPPHQDDLWLEGWTINRWFYWDFYHITPTGAGPIASVTHHMRCNTQGGKPSAQVCAHEFLINGVRYHRPYATPLDGWNYYTRVFTTNLNTGLRWTDADLATLQIGVSLRHTWGPGWYRVGFCSEAYISIQRDYSCPQPI